MINDADIAMADFEAAGNAVARGECLECGGDATEGPMGNVCEGFHDSCMRRIITEEGW